MYPQLFAYLNKEIIVRVCVLIPYGSFVNLVVISSFMEK